MAFGRLRTGQLQQARLRFPIKNPRRWRRLARLARQCRFQTLLHELAARAKDCRRAGVQCCGNSRIIPAAIFQGCVRLEQDPCFQQPVSSIPSRNDRSSALNRTTYFTNGSGFVISITSRTFSTGIQRNVLVSNSLKLRTSRKGFTMIIKAFTAAPGSPRSSPEAARQFRPPAGFHPPCRPHRAA